MQPPRAIEPDATPSHEPMSNLGHQPLLAIRRKRAGSGWLTNDRHVGRQKPRRKEKAGPARVAPDRPASLWWPD